MIKHAFFAWFVGLSVFTGCQPPDSAPSTPASQGPPPPPGAISEPVPASTAGAESLVAAYRAAHASRDVDAMLKLYWFGNADAEMQQTIRENVEAELRWLLTEIKVESVAPGTHGPTVEGGVAWRPSLKVVALLTAKFDTSQAPVGGFHTEQVQLTVGEHGSKHYFTVPLRE